MFSAASRIETRCPVVPSVVPRAAQSASAVAQSFAVVTLRKQLLLDGEGVHPDGQALSLGPSQTDVCGVEHTSSVQPALLFAIIPQFSAVPPSGWECQRVYGGVPPPDHCHLPPFVGSVWPIHYDPPLVVRL